MNRNRAVRGESASRKLATPPLRVIMPGADQPIADYAVRDAIDRRVISGPVIHQCEDGMMLLKRFEAARLCKTGAIQTQLLYLVFLYIYLHFSHIRIKLN